MNEEMELKTLAIYFAVLAIHNEHDAWLNGLFRSEVYYTLKQILYETKKTNDL